MKKHCLIKLAFLTLFLFFFSCKTYIEKVVEETKDSFEIRVKLKVGDKAVIPLVKHLLVEDAITGDSIKLAKKVNYLVIRIEDGNTIVNNKILQSPIKIYSLKNRFININDKDYLGVIKIYPGTVKFDIINYVPIETYLISVLPSEVPVSFNYEALKAQAIVARTYSYYFINKYNNSRNFDVDNTTSYQVYNGFKLFLKNKDVKKIINAVRETEGRIIVYKDQPIIAYFHANSGGRLRSGQDYFGNASAFEYLVAKDDPYSLGYSGDKWSYELALSDVMKILSQDKLGEIVYNSDGFVEKIGIKNGFISARELRRKIGYAKIKCERFKIKIDKDKLVFAGIGYGHGVGMSQWGAHGMAEKGFKDTEIINFYYPNTRIVYY